MKRWNYLLFTALFLGLAWAVRGHFGHEWGAAWAGAIGGMAVVTGTGRKDWLSQLPYISALGALGWGIGGMMSYGIVIGYCRGDDFVNVFYGFTMLGVIGGLYGCMGGGFIGLGLETTKEKQPNWAELITQMVAGALLIWGIVIYQLEMFMTPPRSELWAACLGAALAMIWYMVRNGYYKALKVALLTMIGAGFGFSFGNFIQVLGISSGISYNWWNVMEFTLGFCGGGAMAYAIATTKWEQTKQPTQFVNYLSLAFIFIILPLINFSSAFTTDKITDLAERLRVTPESLIPQTMANGLILLAAIAIAGIVHWHRNRNKWTHQASLALTAILALGYVMLGMIIKGFFHESISISNSVTTYLPIFIIGMYLATRIRQPFEFSLRPWTNARIYRLVGFLILVEVSITLISILVNEPTINTHRRF